MTLSALTDPALHERLQHTDPAIRLEATVTALVVAAVASTTLRTAAPAHEWPTFISVDEAITTALRTLGELAPDDAMVSTAEEFTTALRPLGEPTSDEATVLTAEEFTSGAAALLALLTFLRQALLSLVGEPDDSGEQLLSAAAASIAGAHRVLAVDVP
ncbi:hypothetical protein [Streptosporangium sp. CA-115845]|uniref:hypothetical protein n=1 Tax=Streptosporangium sp. CA-115845 TaxID=3240071 RepID=UPI003D8C5CEA